MVSLLLPFCRYSGISLATAAHSPQKAAQQLKRGKGWERKIQSSGLSEPLVPVPSFQMGEDRLGSDKRKLKAMNTYMYTYMYSLPSIFFCHCLACLHPSGSWGQALGAQRDLMTGSFFPILCLSSAAGLPFEVNGQL